MKIYMSLGSIPELKPLSANDRHRVWTSSYSKVIFSRHGLVGLLIGMIFAFTGAFASTMFETGSLVFNAVRFLGLMVGMFFFFMYAISKARLLMPGIIAKIEEERR